MTQPLTAVLIVHRKNRINHRLRFGTPRDKVRLSWQRALAVFEPGDVFGYVRWRADKFGTLDWRLAIVRACAEGPITQMPGVFPGGDMLLETRGTVHTKRSLSWLDTIQTDVGRLETVSENYWRTAHNLLATGRDPHVLTPLQRAAFTQGGGS